MDADAAGLAAARAAGFRLLGTEPLEGLGFSVDRLATPEGMELAEAQALCAEKLNVLQPYGRAGRLEWQTGPEAEAIWGDTNPKNLFKIAENIRTASEYLDDRQLKASLIGGIAMLIDRKSHPDESPMNETKNI